MRKGILQRINPFLVLFIVLCALAVGSLLYKSTQIWIFTADDAFITFRYSANLVHGIGPTYNNDLPRAEGYTSFLWMIIIAIPHLFNQGVVSFAKLAGIVSTLGTMALILVFTVKASATEKRISRIAGGLVVLFYALLPETAVHTVSGMETAIYCLTLITMVYLAYLGISGSQRALDWLPAAGLVNGLIRPEANLLVVVILLTAAFKTTDKRRFWLRSLYFYLIPGAVYFLWRYLYYGVLFPLPFYIKTEGEGLSGGEYVLSFLIFILTNLALYAGLGLMTKRRIMGLILPVVLADLAFFLFVSPIMGYDFRFLYPLLAVILVLAGAGLALILEKTAGLFQEVRKSWLAVSWVSLLVLFLFSWNNLPRTSAIFTHKLDYANGLLDNHIEIGKTLAQINVEDQNPLLVVTDAGAIPYYSGWETIDAGGLNDPNIAVGLVDAHDYIFSSDPDVMVLTSNDINTFQTDSSFVKSLYYSATTGEMEIISRTPFYQGDSIWVLAKSNSEIAKSLSDWAE